MIPARNKPNRDVGARSRSAVARRLRDERGMGRARWTLVAALGAVGGLVSCFGVDGVTAPEDALYFPTGVAVSPGRSTLFVANSDFDLQYSGGTVMALRLGDGAGDAGSPIGMRARARAVVDAIARGESSAEACARIGSIPNPSDFLHPGPCQALDVAPYVGASVSVGAFATSLGLAANPSGTGLRLLATVRGDPSVTYFDVTDDRDLDARVWEAVTADAPCASGFCLECGAGAYPERCASSYRVGSSALASVRALTLPTEPVGLDTARAGLVDAVVVAHQTEGSASLIVGPWRAGDATYVAPFGSPSLAFVATGLADGPNSVRAIPAPRLVEAAEGAVAYRPGFLLTHRAAPVLTVMRYEADAASRPPRPYLVRAEEVVLSLGGDAGDSRGLAIDSTDRDACEARCGDASPDLACLDACLDVPMRVYVTSRAPASLLVGTITAERSQVGASTTSVIERISFDETVPLPIGPSEVIVGDVVGFDGEFERRVFAIAFDSRTLVSYDPERRAVDALIRTGRGPFGLAVDSGRGPSGEAESFLWVGHFTDSYLGVIDLDARRPTYGSMLVSFGPPVAPRGEQ